ncbi:PHP domain-containing protein, partial [bacterium]|nr:PHP domain-containing protein [bacterium]
MLKVDLHLHSGEDPYDGLTYPATALIDRAAALGFDAIAITLHDRVLADPRVFEYARERGVLLIPGVEWAIQKVDVLLYNVTQAEVDRLRSFEDLRAFRAARGTELLVLAPHPFYPMHHALRHHLEQHLDLFDAIEYSHACHWSAEECEGVRAASDRIGIIPWSLHAWAGWDITTE